MKIRNEILERIANGRCEVLGLGVSNMPLCRWLVGRGADIYGRDKKSDAEMGERAAELKSLGITLIGGDRYLDGIGGDECKKTVIFRSPGIRPDLPQIADAVAAGALLTSEMELFFEIAPCAIIGVTGSDGKTTTTTLIGKMLAAQFERDGTGRRVYIGGNIGEPLLPKVDEMRFDDFAVVELSSFQLMTMRRSPDRAVITNITPNHLNWHTGMEEYAQAKANIYRHVRCGHLTVNAENETTARLGEKADRTVTFFSSKHSSRRDVVPDGVYGASAILLRGEQIIFSDGMSEEVVLDRTGIRLPGIHNVENYMAAISATRGLVSNAVIREVAAEFGGVEHRFEFVREKNGVKFYNSSIDSSPTRTDAALSNLRQKSIVICGGYDKHIPFAPLAESLCRHAKAVVLTGATAGKIKDAVLACPDYTDGLFRIIEMSDFTEAVKTAAEIAAPGDAVILSPACASFDAFPNFEVRGNRFKEIIKNL